MALVVGIDEAGYGPLLGPLIVGASVWHVADERIGGDFWEALAPAVCRKQSRGEHRLAVDDSKALFSQGKSLAPLERSVLAFASAGGAECATLATLLASITDWESDPREREETLRRPPWYGALGRSLPTDRVRSAYAPAAERLRSAMAGSGVECRRLRAAVVSEDRFNQRVGRTRNKASVVVEHVLRFIADAGRAAGRDALHVHVDHLGGRINYRPLLQAAFPERGLAELGISESCSRYRLTGDHGETWEIEFSVDGDARHMPIALASMTCKYLRELIMHEFNAYWRGLCPTLRPTAGYYTDAERFLAEIRPLLAQAGLSESKFVRAR